MFGRVIALAGNGCNAPPGCIAASGRGVGRAAYAASGIAAATLYRLVLQLPPTSPITATCASTAVKTPACIALAPQMATAAPEPRRAAVVWWGSPPSPPLLRQQQPAPLVQGVIFNSTVGRMRHELPKRQMPREPTRLAVCCRAACGSAAASRSPPKTPCPEQVLGTAALCTWQRSRWC